MEKFSGENYALWKVKAVLVEKELWEYVSEKDKFVKKKMYGGGKIKEDKIETAWEMLVENGGCGSEDDEAQDRGGGCSICDLAWTFDESLVYGLATNCSTRHFKYGQVDHMEKSYSEKHDKEEEFGSETVKDINLRRSVGV